MSRRRSGAMAANPRGFLFVLLIPIVVLPFV
jgi:hypothetical protein